MSFKKAFWAVFRVSYFASAVFWVAVLAVRIFPPKDGNYAREFGGSLAINTLMVIILWCFVPESWWGGKKKAKLEKDFVKEWEKRGLELERQGFEVSVIGRYPKPGFGMPREPDKR